MQQAEHEHLRQQQILGRAFGRRRHHQPVLGLAGGEVAEPHRAARAQVQRGAHPQPAVAGAQAVEHALRPRPHRGGLAERVRRQGRGEPIEFVGRERPQPGLGDLGQLADRRERPPRGARPVAAAQERPRRRQDAAQVQHQGGGGDRAGPLDESFAEQLVALELEQFVAAFAAVADHLVGEPHVAAVGQPVGVVEQHHRRFGQQVLAQPRGRAEHVGEQQRRSPVQGGVALQIPDLAAELHAALFAQRRERLARRDQIRVLVETVMGRRLVERRVRQRDVGEQQVAGTRRGLLDLGTLDGAHRGVGPHAHRHRERQGQHRQQGQGEQHRQQRDARRGRRGHVRHVRRQRAARHRRRVHRPSSGTCHCTCGAATTSPCGS